MKAELTHHDDVLSASGIFEGTREEKNLLCLLSDGRLLVADGQEMNPHVLSYRARLERLKRTYRVEVVDIEIVRRLYGASGVDFQNRHASHSMMQVNAKDLIRKASDAQASDVHIRIRKNSTDIYYRIQNDLVRAGSQTRDYGERLVATIYGAMASVSDSSYKPTERQDASISGADMLPVELSGVRIATAPTNEGVVMVLRLLYNSAGDVADLNELGFTPSQILMLQCLKEQPIGINIISGPTGSGKSTSLQRILLGEIRENEGRLHVLTVEDPVEYPIIGAVQTAVTNAGTEDERSLRFSAAIANAMRLDPDTIMIGEVRDRASAQSALRASMTGHQVWTTVHANSAVAIVDRLVDLGLPINLVADHTVVTGLISQRLVKLLCPHCKQRLVDHARQLSTQMVQRLKLVLADSFENIHIQGDGCAHCRKEGTCGRVAVAEVILPDAQFFDYVRTGEKTKATQYWLQELQGQTMMESAIDKVRQGLIDPRLAEKVVGYLSNGNHHAMKRLSVVETSHAN